MSLPNTAVYEVRSTGNDQFGGGFDSAKSGTGTDYSQQTTAHVAFNGSTITATITGSGGTIIITGYTVATTDTGNFLQIVSGTGSWTAGVYEISSVNVGSNTWTLNRNVSTGTSSAMVGNMGGCFATINQANAVIVGANIIWVKATASYVLTSALILTANGGGTTGGPIKVIGYTTTRGDAGIVTLTTSTNSIRLVQFSNATHWAWYNFLFSSTAGTPGDGWHATGASCQQNSAVNCKWTGFNIGINGNWNTDFDFDKLTLVQCEVTASVSDGVQNSGSSSVNTCYFHGNGGSGFYISDGINGILSAIHCVFKSNTGDGIKATSANHIVYLESCAVINNTADGMNILYQCGFEVHNSIFDSNGGYAFNITGGQTVPVFVFESGNAFWNNTSGNTNGGFTLDASDITLTGDAFVSRSSANFALNSTAGAGASCKGAGFPGVSLIGTGYPDIGPLQSNGGGGGSVYLGGSAAGMSSIIAM